MIRHHPFGSGHPYRTDIDQRVPSRSLAGQPVALGVAAARSVVEITCEWDDGASRHPLTLQPASPSESPAAKPTSPGDTHLAAAAAGEARGASVPWTVSAPVLPSHGHARYRFIAKADTGRVTRSRWFEVYAASWQSDGGQLNVTGTSRIRPGTVQWLRGADGVHRVRFALTLESAERVLGFGERYDRLDQRGHCIDAVVFEQYKGQGVAGRTYLPMPFAHVLGGAGWAFYLDTSHRTWFDVGATDDSTIWVESDLGGAGAEELRIQFYDGSPEDVLHTWQRQVGQPQRLPSWVFDLWASGNEWNSQGRVLAEMDRHRAEDIPLGVVVIEAWSDESTFATFRDARYPVHADGSPHTLADFDFPSDGAWPDPKAMVDELHARGIRVLLWQIPLAKMRPHPTGQAKADATVMLERGYGVKEADGRPYRNRGWWFPLALMPDFTNLEARRWWLAKRRYLVDEIGIDGFKTDGGEHAWGHDLRYADGRRGTDGNNLYPVHYAAAYGELLTDCGKPPVTFSRAGYTGSQAHGIVWAGDEDSTWAALRASLTAGLNAAACGIVYWGWDLAGFSGDVPDAELYLRAAALSCFVPIMQYHSEFNHHRTPLRDRTPWNIAERTGDPSVLPIFRRFAHLRKRLVPYLSEQADVTIETGRPLMRSLALADPTNPQVWKHPYQYLLGDDLLIAPVIQPDADSWPVHLPSGHWVDVWTGDHLAGPVNVTVPTPLHTIPVWCRAKAWPRLRATFSDPSHTEHHRTATAT